MAAELGGQGVGWDAPRYDEEWREKQGRFVEDVLARLRLAAGDVVADIGCGTGRLARALLEREPGLRVVALDVDPGMLAQARGQVGEVFRPQFRFVQANGLALPIRSETADCAVMASMLHWLFPRTGLGLAGVARILKVGGALGIINPVRRRHEGFTKHVLFDAAVAEAQVDDHFNGQAHHLMSARIPLDDDLMQWLRAVGFSIAYWEVKSDEVTLTDVAWDRIVVQDFKAASAHLPREAQDRLLKCAWSLSSKWRGVGSVRLERADVVVVAHLRERAIG